MTRRLRRFAQVLPALAFARNPTTASAHTDGWQIDLAPLYLEAATLPITLSMHRCGLKIGRGSIQPKDTI